VAVVQPLAALSVLVSHRSAAKDGGRARMFGLTAIHLRELSFALNVFLS
jgi:hypothetical protein